MEAAGGIRGAADDRQRDRETNAKQRRVSGRDDHVRPATHSRTSTRARAFAIQRAARLL